jgi:hypothetical protein
MNDGQGCGIPRVCALETRICLGFIHNFVKSRTLIPYKALRSTHAQGNW